MPVESNSKVSDIHIAPGKPCTFRVDGELVPIDNVVLMPKDTEALANELMTDKERAILRDKGEVDFAYSKIGKCRIAG